MNLVVKVVVLDALRLLGQVTTPLFLVTVDGTLDLGVSTIESSHIGTYRRAPSVILNEFFEDLLSSLAHESRLHH